MALEAWLALNRHGWKASPASFVPGIVVSSERFSLNFLPNGVVVNYEAGQFTRDSGSKLAEKLSCKPATQPGAAADV